MRNALILTVLCAALGACKSEDKAAAAPAGGDKATPAKPSPGPTPAAADAAPAQAAPAKPREGGPTQEQCEKFADHVAGFIAEGLTPPGAGDAEKKELEKTVRGDRATTLRFCLEALEAPEVECVMKATDFNALASCERLRRQVPKDMLARNEVTAEDCERFFVRYRQFMVAQEVPAAKIEADKDQIVRACLEKAKPGTVACYITAQTYDEARRCP